MRPKFLFPFFAFLTLLSPHLSQAFDPTADRISKTSPVQLAYPAVEMQTLPNGMTVYFLENHELPLIQMQAFIRGGSIQVPSDQIGLASIVSTVLRSGGTQKLSSEKIDQILEDHGAAIEMGMTREFGTASLSGLSKDADLLVGLFFDMLYQPRFEKKALELARSQALEALRRKNDNPQQIAFRVFPKLLYGKESPWARTPTAETLSKIQSKDLFAFHKKFYHPDQIDRHPQDRPDSGDCFQDSKTVWVMEYRLFGKG